MSTEKTRDICSVAEREKLIHASKWSFNVERSVGIMEAIFLDVEPCLALLPHSFLSLRAQVCKISEANFGSLLAIRSTDPMSLGYDLAESPSGKRCCSLLSLELRNGATERRVIHVATT